MIETKHTLTNIYVKHVGRPFDELTKLMDRDHFMTAQKSVEFGLADQIITYRKDAKETK